jgi:hypothetical protein
VRVEVKKPGDIFAGPSKNERKVPVSQSEEKKDEPTKALPAKIETRVEEPKPSSHKERPKISIEVKKTEKRSAASKSETARGQTCYNFSRWA